MRGRSPLGAMRPRPESHRTRGLPKWAGAGFLVGVCMLGCSGDTGPTPADGSMSDSDDASSADASATDSGRTGCSVACPEGAECVDGGCECTEGKLCGDQCVDVTTNPMHCSDCGSPCDADETCKDAMCVDCGPEASLSDDVQPVFDASCTDSNCHTGVAPAAGLSLEQGNAYDDLVHEPAGGCSDGRLLVEPGSADGSYLIHKLTGDGICSGGQMPLRAEPLSSSNIDRIRAWICRGALDN